MAPINPQITPYESSIPVSPNSRTPLTGHKTTRITNQKCCRPSVLLRFAQPTKHILLRPFGLPLGEFFKERFDHGSYDVTGRDGVDSDAVLAPLGGEVAA